MAGHEQGRTVGEDPQERIQRAKNAGARVVTDRVAFRIGHDPLSEMPDGLLAGDWNHGSRDRYAHVPTEPGTPYAGGHDFTEVKI